MSCGLRTAGMVVGRWGGEAAALLALATLASGCASPPQRDLLVIGLSQTIVTMDPAMHRDRTTETVHRNMFDGLVTRDADMNVVPELAESWRVVDERTWEFRLRKGVRFHNGEPFAADDVKFTLDRVIQPGRIGGKSSPRKGLLGPLERVEVVDDRTVRMITAEPWPTLIAMLPFHEIVPRDYVEEHGEAHFAEHPVGTGPFRFVEWRKGEHVVLARFDDYYGGATALPPVGPARVRRLVFRPIPETATRVAALKAGECHLIQALPPHLLDNVTDDPRTEALSCVGTRSHFVGMNCTRPPFDDRRVRQAMNYAVDMRSIVDGILEGAALVLPGPLVPEAFGHDPELPVYERDLGRAEKLLTDSGRTDLSFELDCTADDKDVAAAIADQLREAGLTAKLRVWEWGVLRSELEQLNRDCFLGSWGNGSLDPVGILNPTLRTADRGNYTGYSNPEVDALLDQAMVTMEPTSRAALYRRVERLIRDDAPWIFGYSLTELYAARSEVGGWQPTPDGRMNMHDTYLTAGR